MLRGIAKIALLVAELILAGASLAHAAGTVSADDTARFLAGMPPSADSPLMPLTQDPVWQHHAKFFDAAFAQLEQRQLSRIAAWSEVNLAAPRPTMFYMFSGPDFIYANAFYPKASTYVLGALEPTGMIPDVTKLPYGGIGRALSYVERSLGSMLNFSFFITKQMKADLRTGELDGTLPILYVLLARSGKVIRDVSLIWLDDTGAVHGSDEAAPANAARGTRITFAGKEGVEQTLYYVSTDLSNSSVGSSGFLKFCQPLAPGNSLIKSASYLMHERSFSVVRHWLLANSATIIQDDSGIPIASFDPGRWRFFPFGRYDGPIDKFPGRYQEAYADLFERSQPLDFGIGYRWRPHESNLLLSVRAASGDAGQTDVPVETATQAAQPRPRRRPPREPMLPPPLRYFWFPR